MTQTADPIRSYVLGIIENSPPLIVARSEGYLRGMGAGGIGRSCDVIAKVERGPLRGLHVIYLTVTRPKKPWEIYYYSESWCKLSSDEKFQIQIPEKNNLDMGSRLLPVRVCGVCSAKAPETHVRSIWAEQHRPDPLLSYRRKPPLFWLDSETCQKQFPTKIRVIMPAQWHVIHPKNCVTEI